MPFPYKPRRNRRNRQLPSYPDQPPAAEQLEIWNAWWQIGGVDDNILLVILSDVAHVPGNWGDLPYLGEGGEVVRWGGWANVSNIDDPGEQPSYSGVSTTPTRAILLEYAGISTAFDYNWPATPLIRSASGGITNAKAGTVQQAA